MLKETIHFTDFNNQPASTVEYFNLSKNEIIDLEASIEGGLASMMRRVEDNPTAKGVLELLKTLTHASYGIKSDDGRYFEKSDEITKRFISSAFYDDFLFSLVENDAQKGLAFIRGILPAKLVADAETQIALNQNSQAAEIPQTYAPSAPELFAAQQESARQVMQLNQPEYPKFEQNQPALTPSSDQLSPEDEAEFRAWQARKRAAESTQTTAAAPASPDAFRVREEEPVQGLPRPPHEQTGPAQP